jgi:GNAT superfamily N-acetyltransferase
VRAPARYGVLPASPEHVACLAAVETAAARLFPVEDLPDDLAESPTPTDELARAQAAGRLWVALSPNGEVLGFAQVVIVDGHAHLQEMDVDPAHGRRGIGTALVHAVVGWARVRGDAKLTLTTFRHLAWNAPFYSRLGFREIEPAESTQALCEILAAEATAGLDPTKRLAMSLSLHHASQPTR